MMAPEPLVSICIPAYQGSRWIRDAVESALAQDYSSIEVLVVDDCSTDDTAAIARSIRDSRLRVHVNPTNLGLVGNWDRCVALARGEFVKFLFQDDLLATDCVRELVAACADDQVGMAFSGRTILLDDPADPRARAWRDRFGAVDRGFAHLERQNRGQDLFAQEMAGSFAENWVGEPSCVLVRTECFRSLGLFNRRMHQDVDLEMWLRVMYHYDVGFVDRPLATFRVHGASATQENQRADRIWLDRFWLLEGLAAHPAIKAVPRVASMRRRAVASVIREALRADHRTHAFPFVWRRLGSLASYVAFRLLAALGTRPILHRPCSHDGSNAVE
jgi:glycosyltransferase involved in cell wall biosynthesis